MSSLFIDRQNVQLKLDSGALVFREGGERIGTVPLAPISRVFVRGSALLPASLLGKLGDAGAGVVILSGRQAQPTLMLSRPHSDARRRIAQVKTHLDPAFCLAFARQLVQDKLTAHRQLLDELLQSRPQHRYDLTRTARALERHMEAIATADTLATLRGVEGAAAGAWFGALRAILPASMEFTGRNRRPPRDPFNALLSLSYTLAGAEIVLALHGSGLDPAIGYYHCISYGRHSLACDLLEPLRADIDRFCLRLISQQTITRDHFSTASGEGGACILGKAGRTRYYDAWEQHATTTLRRAIGLHVQRLLQSIASAMPELAPDSLEENNI